LLGLSASIGSAFSELVLEATSESMDSVTARWHGPGIYILHALH
jgi:hypothetical protein